MIEGEVRPFEKNEVERYERKRYRGLDQKVVDWREKRLLIKNLKTIKKYRLQSSGGREPFGKAD